MDIKKLAETFAYWANQSLEKIGAKKKQEKAVFPANSPKVKDKKMHYPLSNIGQARNALARSHQYSKVPPWYKGSLEELQAAVRRAVKKHYPSIEVSQPKKSKR